MVSFFRSATSTKEDNAKLDAARNIRDDVQEADFIPIACHFDPHTLLTKNGELLQIVRIDATADGLRYEPPERQVALRDAVRAALLNTCADTRFSFWFHTLRRRAPLARRASFPESFAAALDDAWRTAHPWTHAYCNELYLTVLHEGVHAPSLSPKHIVPGLRGGAQRRWHEEALESAGQMLSSRVEALIEQLSTHAKASRLGVVERVGMGPCSEPLELLHYLINLDWQHVPLSDTDASTQLATGDIAFGFDALEVRHGKKRRFAAVLAPKGAVDLSPEVLDRCLQPPDELVVTQAFHFVPPKAGGERLRSLRALLGANREQEMLEMTGVKAMLESTRGQATDFGEQHTSVLVAGDDYEALHTSVGRVQNHFLRRGLVTVREDLMLEDGFWAQLPGNFPFAKRRTTIATPWAGRLMRLNHFPVGAVERAHWGAPVALLPTPLRTPYAFEFHHEGCGHTAVLDFNSFADARGATLVNFLLAQSRRFPARVIVFDRGGTGRLLVEALGGQSVQPLAPGSALSLNPFALPDTPRNRGFLAAWMMQLLPAQATQDVRAREGVKQAIDALMAQPPEQRHLRQAIAEVQTRLPSASFSTAPWQRLLEGAADTLPLATHALHIEMDAVVAAPGAVTPVFSYLLHRLIDTLDASPTILVLHEAWDLLDNPFFAPRLASLLDMFKERGVVVMFTTRRLEANVASPVTATIMAHTPTKIFLPDDVGADYFSEVTGLSTLQTRTLATMDRQRGEFLLAHGQEVVECVMDDSVFGERRSVLAGDARALRLRQIRQE